MWQFPLTSYLYGPACRVHESRDTGGHLGANSFQGLAALSAPPLGLECLTPGLLVGTPGFGQVIPTMVEGHEQPYS